MIDRNLLGVTYRAKEKEQGTQSHVFSQLYNVYGRSVSVVANYALHWLEMTGRNADIILNVDVLPACLVLLLSAQLIPYLPLLNFFAEKSFFFYLHVSSMYNQISNISLSTVYIPTYVYFLEDHLEFQGRCSSFFIKLLINIAILCQTYSAFHWYIYNFIKKFSKQLTRKCSNNALCNG